MLNSTHTQFVKEIRQKVKTHYSDDFIRKVIEYHKRFADTNFFAFKSWIYGQLKYYGEERRTFSIPIVRHHFPSSKLLLLDLGCGLGCSTVVYSSQGYQAVGIDTDGDAVKIAKMRAREDKADCQLVVGDARRLPFRSVVFDVCLCIEVIEHMGSGREELIYETLRVTKELGIIQIETPNRLSLKDHHDTRLYLINCLPKKIAWFYARLRNRILKSGLSNYVTIFYLKRLLRSCDCKILGDIMGYNFDELMKYACERSSGSRNAQLFVKLCRIPKFELIVRVVKIFLPNIYLTVRKE